MRTNERRLSMNRGETPALRGLLEAFEDDQPGGRVGSVAAKDQDLTFRQGLRPLNYFFAFSNQRDFEGGIALVQDIQLTLFAEWHLFGHSRCYCKIGAPDLEVILPLERQLAQFLFDGGFDRLVV